MSVKAAKQASRTVTQSIQGVTQKAPAEVWTVASLGRLTPARIDVPLSVSPPLAGARPRRQAHPY